MGEGVLNSHSDYYRDNAERLLEEPIPPFLTKHESKFLGCSQGLRAWHTEDCE